MFADNGGALWLSDPTVVLVVLVGVVGLTMWCHRWLETGSMPTPRSMASRQGVQRNINVVQTRTLREKIEARPTQAANTRYVRSGRPLARTRRSGGYPKQAA